MTTGNITEWIGANVGTGIVAAIGFMQKDPILQILTWLSIATVMGYNYYRFKNERAKYIKNKSDEAERTSKE